MSGMSGLDSRVILGHISCDHRLRRYDERISKWDIAGSVSMASSMTMDVPPKRGSSCVDSIKRIHIVSGILAYIIHNARPHATYPYRVLESGAPRPERDMSSIISPDSNRL